MKTPISKIWIWLSFGAGLLMLFVSVAGILFDDIYAKETVSWSSQAKGQDIINVFLVFPLLAVCLFFIRKGSWRAYLIWLGVLIYMIYSYALYAFFIHFGPLFLPYIAILGMAFYSFVGGLAQINQEEVKQNLSGSNQRPASIFLMIVSVLFFLLWLGDILYALISGSLPQGVSDIGLLVNPVQVLDLAFLLPASAITSVMLWKQKSLGYVLAVPLMVFFATMGIAIVCMMLILSQKGYPAPIPQMIMMGVIIAADIAIIRGFLKR